MHFFPAVLLLHRAFLMPMLLTALLISVTVAGQTVPKNEISPSDKKKFISICQYWINMLAKEGGYKVARDYNITITENSHNFNAYFYENSINPGGISLSVSFTRSPARIFIRFIPDGYKDNNANLNYFLSTVFYTNLRAKNVAIKINKVKYWKEIFVENFQFEEEEEYKRIYSEQSSVFNAFNVKAAFDLEDEMKSPKSIAANNNLISASREKGNLYYQQVFYSQPEFPGDIVKAWRGANSSYQQAWALGDDTAALLLGFFYLNPVYKIVVTKNIDDNDKNSYERYHGEINDYKLYNPVKAMAYFDSASRMGNTTGYYGIGQMHEYGLGMEKNITKAISFYEKGAARANLYCLKALYHIYTNDLANKNQEKAKECKEKIDYLDNKKSLLRWPWTFVLPALINND